MFRLSVALILFTACGFSKNVTDKTAKTYSAESSCSANDAKCFNQDAQAFEADGSKSNMNPAIDLSKILSDPLKVLAAEALFDGFKDKIKEQAESIGIKDLKDEEMDAVFDEVIAAGKAAKAKDLDGLIAELDPLVMEILKTKPSIEPHMEIIEAKKPQAIMLIKFLLPGMLENGIESVNIEQAFPKLL